jgi:bifunctional UDP-N-acetylglucosamine pyrophosphorylase/glucosamine-1-phosphate N-acetyltransferase
MKNKSIIILAAGAGTRMRSTTPKVLHKISGKPMLYYSIKEALELSDDVTVVLYHQAQRVQEEMEKFFDGINYVIQDHENYPGTGGAVMNITPKYEKVLVLNGDMPLIQADELKKFEIEATIVMSVLELDSADGYGRVIVEDGAVKKIVEQKDANETELAVTTANAGIYQFDTKFLLESLPKLSNDNAQKEYYITDLVEMAINQGKVLKPLTVNEENFKGVNSKLDLSEAEVLKSWCYYEIT